MATANIYQATRSGNRYESDDKEYQIKQETEERVWRTAQQGNGAITRRLKELDEEWDIERLLEIQAATFALKFLLFGAIINKKYYWVPAVIGVLLLEQSIQGWSPPYALYRKLGKRSAKEINEERYALKALRGDFDHVDSGSSSISAIRAMRAARDGQ